MLKHLVGRLFGFDAEISELRRRVEELSWDSCFGMWTREAFLQFCHVMPRATRYVAFIDLNRIHDLNELLGYSEVDRRVKEMFSVPFRRSDIVARWYSGDEIVILFDSDMAVAQQKMDELNRSAAEQDLTFYYEIGPWEISKQTIEDVVDRLTKKVIERKGRELR